ncbi:MAG: alpha-ketoacid dehydrogenase subunit beta [Christensenella sp.]|uniref:alpha-ketoacid dehydrogenase subunit beta n=1 Tax=Christensenella sp. TaxID=1935934 RepID=UPI002B1F627C|nr:alpha-ketoacid dehydrogenase subunit beta [Christensenella sp.]MEA5003090.1 alpha-ketoacid dehydrogenase subunit beta [Christensenella sp.]
MSKKTYAMAVRDTLLSEMKRDDKVFVMGEDVQVLGGVFGCTRGLADELGADRCFNTPIAEAEMVGAGLGAACAGMRPVVELMYMDFTLVAMDQIINQVAKTRYIFGGKAKIPLVIRGQEGIGRGNAATHSQSLETIFMHFPGIKVACPSTGEDVAGLLRTAIRDDNPVLFFEHKALYSNKEEVPDDPDFMIPFGQAKIRKEGTDVTIVANLLYVSRALEAAAELEKEGISAEVIDPRTLVPFDYETIVNSVKKTGRLVTVHEAHRTAGWGAEVAAEITERAFPYLDHAPIRLGAKQCPLPFNVILENATVPQVKEIIDAARASMYK